MRRRRKLGVYAGVIVFLVSLFWYVTTPGPPARPTGPTDDDAHGFESIYPGDKSFGAQKHVKYPTRKPTKTPLQTGVQTSTAASAAAGLVVKLKDILTYAQDNVEIVEDRATDLPKKQTHTPDVFDRPRSAATRRVYEEHKTQKVDRRTHKTASTQPTDAIHRLMGLSSNMTPRVMGANSVEYPTRPPQSRVEQSNKRTTRTRVDLSRKSNQPDKEWEAETIGIAQVYEKINFNADNSIKFFNISLPVKRRPNASETSNKLVAYPTKIPRKDVDAMFRLRALGHATNRVRVNATTHAREDIARATSRAPDSSPNVRVTVRRVGPAPGGAGPGLQGENIVSMSVYGSAPRYLAGAMRNAELIRENFPGWKLRVYTEVPSHRPRYGVVPQTVVERLRALGADIYLVDPLEETIPPMMWRFLVADDLSVDRFIVRDADSRLTERDAAAVRAWIASGKPFNCIRDHPSHAQYAVSGGMWGGKPAALKYILRKSWRELMKGSGDRYLQDMTFLIQIIWPKVEAHAYCSDSVSCDQWPNAHPFPVPRYGYDTVGQVVNEHEMGRVGDIQILRRAGENRKCSPKIADLSFA